MQLKLNSDLYEQTRKLLGLSQYVVVSADDKILIQAEANGMQMSKVLDGEILEKGSCSIPSSAIKALRGKWSGNVDIKTDKNVTITTDGGKSARIIVPLMNISIKPLDITGEPFDIDPEQFAWGVTCVLACIANNTIRQMENAVIEIDGTVMRIIGTNSITLAVASIPCQADSTSFSVHSRFLSTGLAALKGSESVKIAVGDGLIALICDGTRLIARTDPECLAWRKAYDADTEELAFFACNAADLLRLCEDAAEVSGSGIINITADSGVKISSDGDNKSRFDLPADVSGKSKLNLGLSVLKALSPLGKKDIRVSMREHRLVIDTDIASIVLAGRG